MQLLCVVNPKAGAGNKDWQELIGNWLTEHGHQCAFYVIEPGTDCGTAIQQQIEQYKPERVLVAGGDGTIKSVAEVLVGQNIPLGIIAAGSANGLARELNVPADVNKALELALTGKPAAVDMIKVNDEWCIHLSDMGLNARMLQYFEQDGSRGMWGYLKGVFKSWGRHTFMRMNIETDKETMYCKALMVVIANASKYGTGAVINPSGSMSDGIFEIVIVRRVRFSTLLNMMLRIRPFQPANIEILKCSKVQLTATRNYPFQVDGEYRGKQQRITASIVPAAIQVVMPESTT